MEEKIEEKEPTQEEIEKYFEKRRKEYFYTKSVTRFLYELERFSDVLFVDIELEQKYNENHKVEVYQNEENDQPVGILYLDTKTMICLRERGIFELDSFYYGFVRYTVKKWN